MQNNLYSDDALPLVRWLLCGAMFGLMAALPLGAGGQEADFWERWPGGRELTAPDYARPVPPLLPVSPAPPPSAEPPLSIRERVFVRRFDLTGNTVFTAEELATVTAPYTNRAISAEELQEARRQLTVYYVERGYLNSGAVIPDQQVGTQRCQIGDATRAPTSEALPSAFNSGTYRGCWAAVRLSPRYHPRVARRVQEAQPTEEAAAESHVRA